jgi:hypothetical protein
VRKANVYLSQPKPRHVIAGLARAIPHWKHLVRRVSPIVGALDLTYA